MIQDGVTEDEYNEIIDAFLSFLDHYHAENLSDTMADAIANARVVGGTTLLAIDQKTKELVVVDPIPKQ